MDVPTMWEIRMDDRQAYYLSLVGDLCAGASDAALPVHLEMASGLLVTNVPEPRSTSDSEEVDQTGWASRIRFEGEYVRLEEVVSCAMRAPDPEQSHHMVDDPDSPIGGPVA